jgi:protein-S-isoprenylcysteine O-methyltransferase Ste14
MEQKRKIIPPIWLTLALVTMWLLHRFFPIMEFGGRWRFYTGGLLAVGGILIAATSAGAFRKAGTSVIPFERSTALVTGGFYRYTRNPMYLGMVLLLLGIALMLGSVSAFLPIAVFIGIIQSRFIVGEERFLESIFGEQYLAYKRQVRRWL